MTPKPLIGAGFGKHKQLRWASSSPCNSPVRLAQIPVPTGLKSGVGNAPETSKQGFIKVSPKNYIKAYTGGVPVLMRPKGRNANLKLLKIKNYEYYIRN